MVSPSLSLCSWISTLVDVVDESNLFFVDCIKEGNSTDNCGKENPGGEKNIEESAPTLNKFDVDVVHR